MPTRTSVVQEINEVFFYCTRLSEFNNLFSHAFSNAKCDKESGAFYILNFANYFGGFKIFKAQF